MGYIKKEFREKLEIMDCRYNDNLPEYWDKFIENTRVKHNLIIKRKGSSICTNCKHEFQTKKRVGEYQKCPNCTNTYLIKSSHLKKFWFTDTLILLDKVQNDLVFRYFELWSAYDNKTMYYGFDASIVEYGRSFFKRNVEVVNDRVSRCQCYIHINHLDNPGRWREYIRYYDFGKSGYIYPYNLKQLLKDTQYKYLNLKELSQNVGRVNFEYLLRNIATYPSFELLSKMKLYKLALRADEFRNHGTFQQIFGVSKDYYPFMKRNNITYNELEMLRLLQQKDINKIRYLSNFSESVLKEIAGYINLDKFIKYAKMHRGKIDVHMYKDYLRFAKLLGLDLKNKKYTFPDNLEERHDELEKSYEVKNREILNKSIAERYKELKQNIYKDEEFIIIPAKNVEALEKESKEQSNCVRTYSEKYATGKCDIYFMRLLKNKNKSLVTVEVKDNKVVQSRIKYNAQPNPIQLLFLKKWQEQILQKCRV